MKALRIRRFSRSLFNYHSNSGFEINTIIHRGAGIQFVHYKFPGSLPDFRSNPAKVIIGAPGFEPGVICSQSRHVSRYTTPRLNTSGYPNTAGDERLKVTRTMSDVL